MKKKYIAPCTEVMVVGAADPFMEFFSADPTYSTDDCFSRQPNRRLWDDDEDDFEDWY